MLRKAKRIARTLSFRLSLRVITVLATLLMVALLVMLFFSRKAVKEEALHAAEQTLEATVQSIDNILLDVEQAAGNVYWKMIRSHLQGDGRENLYVRKLVETNPYISDARLIWMTEDSLPSIQGNMALWSDPVKEDNVKGSAVTSFRLPVFDGQRIIGLMVVDVSLDLLSKIVLEAKPSPNSFSTLLGSDGSYIVHPDSKKLNRNVFELAKKLLLANGMSLDDILKGKSYDKGSAYTEPRQAWDMNRITKLLSEGRIKAKQDEEKKEDKASITNASNRSKAINANKKPTASTTK